MNHTPKINVTTQVVKLVIPKEFVESCEYNQQIELVRFFEDQKICIKEGELIIGIKNTGFDPIETLKLIIGTTELISEQKDLSEGRVRKYRFDDVTIPRSLNEIIVIPRGEFQQKIYDCEVSKLKIKTTLIKECLI